MMIELWGSKHCDLEAVGGGSINKRGGERWSGGGGGGVLSDSV